MKQKGILLILSGLFSLSLLLPAGCKKTIHEDLHLDTTIDGNNPPDYHGISQLQIQTYVNKLYIDLNGREPSATELNADVSYLKLNNLSGASRKTIIASRMSSIEYDNRLFTITASDFINSTDSSLIQDQVNLFNYIYYLDSVNGNTINLFYYQYELYRLDNLMNAKMDLRNGIIDLHEYYYRFLNNYFYDQVNMGTQNFVIGSFDDLFKRAPTASELTNGSLMVDGQSSTLLLMDGSSKSDYMNIVTNCDEFLQGMVRKGYTQFLLREPTTAETGLGIQTLQLSFDYKEYLKTLLSTDEYAGF